MANPDISRGTPARKGCAQRINDFLRRWLALVAIPPAISGAGLIISAEAGADTAATIFFGVVAIGGGIAMAAAITGLITELLLSRQNKQVASK